MTQIPETRYAQSGDVSIAYQVTGSGPVDLIMTPGFVSHLDHSWDDPSFARCLQRLAAFCRLIRFDKRGTGLSDRDAGIPSLEQRMDDIRAVMDSAGSRRAAILGISEGGPMSALFAATYPERIEALILYGTSPRTTWAPDYPWGIPVEEAAAGDVGARIEASRYFVEHIPGAKFVELPGSAHFHFVGDADSFADEIQEFLTGERTAPEPDRILATVLLTDIADSTRRAAEMGDHRWRQLLGNHNVLAKKAIARFRGRTIKSTGDGYLATFDGPARAVQCAFAIRRESRQLGLAVRAGLHTGEVELMGDEIGSIAVHLAARVAADAQADEVWTSRTVRDLVAGSGLAFSERGDFELKGTPGAWPLYAVD